MTSTPIDDITGSTWLSDSGSPIRKILSLASEAAASIGW